MNHSIGFIYIQMDKPQLTTLVTLHQYLFALSALAYLPCTLLTLGVFSLQFSMSLYQLLLRISCLLMVGSEITEWQAGGSKKGWAIVNGLMGVAGSLIYIRCSFIYDSFNDGTLYMVGSFFVCSAAELKILVMLVKAGKNAVTAIRKNKSKFQSQVLIVISAFAFLGSSVLYQINLADDVVDVWSKVCNFTSGVSMAASAYYLLLREEDKEQEGKHHGYIHFEQMPESIDN